MLKDNQETLLILHSKLAIIKTNKNFSKVVNKSIKEIINKPCNAIFSSDFCNKIKNNKQLKISINNENYEVKITHLFDKYNKFDGALLLFTKKDNIIKAITPYLENAIVWIDILDKKGNIIFWNKAAEKISEYKTEEVIGHDKVWEWLYPDENYRNRIFEKAQKIINEKDIVLDFITEITTKSGKKKFISWYSNSFDTNDELGSIAFGIDITEKMTLENKFKKSEELFKKVFFTTPNAIAITTLSDGKYIQVNKGFEKLTGFKMEEVIGKTSLELNIWVNPEDRKKLTATLKNQKSVSNIVFVFRTKDGKIKNALISAAIFEINDKKFILSIIKDITDLKNMEQEKEKLRQQLIQAQKLESVGRLAGGIAHDFNNMLSIIYNYVQLAQMNLPKNDKIYNHLEIIMKTAERAAELVKQLLAFARKMPSIPKIIDLNSSIKESIKMLKRLIPETILIHFHPTDDKCLIKIDPIQLQQILTNILLNAKDAITEYGNIWIKTEIVDIENNETVFKLPPEKYVKLSIKDDGIGMSENIKKNIFEPFFTTKKNGKGSGLGLSTVYGIIKQNEGFIFVESEENKGSEFLIFFPLQSESEEAIPKDDNLNIKKSEKIRILIVEDEEVLLNSYMTFLKDIGYDVYGFSDPVKALNFIKNDKEKVDLLITDITMPFLNGKQFANKVKAISPQTRIIFITGYDKELDSSFNSKENPKVKLIRKPFSMPTLVNEIKSFFEN